MAGEVLIHSTSNHRWHALLPKVWSGNEDEVFGTVEVPREEFRDRDWSNRWKGEAYADARRGSMPKSIRIGDIVEKSNKLSTNFRPSPFKLV